MSVIGEIRRNSKMFEREYRCEKAVRNLERAVPRKFVRRSVRGASDLFATFHVRTLEKEAQGLRLRLRLRLSSLGKYSGANAPLVGPSLLGREGHDYM
jgi:ribosomal protein L31E